MIWRPAYRTLEARNVELPAPELPADILVGGFDFAALRNMNIWRRLAAADASSCRYLEVIFLRDPKAPDQTLLETIVPHSQLATTRLVADPARAWQTLIAPGKPEDCFAAAVRNGHASVVMKGLPTEEAWDAFLVALRT